MKKYCPVSGTTTLQLIKYVGYMISTCINLLNFYFLSFRFFKHRFKTPRFTEMAQNLPGYPMRPPFQVLFDTNYLFEIKVRKIGDFLFAGHLI